MFFFGGGDVRDLEMELTALHTPGNPSIAEPPSMSCLQLYEDVYFVWVGLPKIIFCFILLTNLLRVNNRVAQLSSNPQFL